MVLPCFLIFFLRMLGSRDVSVHENSVGMLWYVFFLDRCVHIKEVTQSGGINEANKTGYFMRALIQTLL